MDGRIVVRAARKGEKVVTLDDVERPVPEGACLIADPERAVAIAGVMGCANSEVLPDTTEIILEVANFDMRSIRATRDSVYSILDPSGAFTVIMNRPSSSSGMKPLSIRLKRRPLTTTTAAAAPTTVQRRRRLAEIKRR